MKIMCLNGWGGTLDKELTGYLSCADVDVICLQEVVHTPQTKRDVLEYRDGSHVLPQKARLFEVLCDALPEHRAVFCPAAQGVLWDGDIAVPSQWGLASFVHRRLTVTAQRQGFVHKGFSPDGYGEHPRSRSAHAMRLYDFERGAPITIAHMHGLRDLAGKGDTAARSEQARAFADLALSVAEPGDDLVLCGDFNVLPDSETLTLLQGLGLTELVTARGEAGTRTGHYKKEGRFADYMLVSSGLIGAEFEVVRSPEVSDHCPLILRIDGASG